MRTSALLGLVVALTCVPAFAEEGNVSRATLKALGLGGAEMLTDAQGMEVRGMASSAASSGTSLIFGQLIAPDGSFLVASDVNTSSASQNRRRGRSSRAASGRVSGFDVGLLIDTKPKYDGAMGGIVGGFSFGAAGGNLSP